MGELIFLTVIFTQFLAFGLQILNSIRFLGSFNIPVSATFIAGSLLEYLKSK